MKGGTKLDVPLWLAQTLHDEGAVKLFPPRCFSPKFRDNMEVRVRRVMACCCLCWFSFVT